VAGAEQAKDVSASPEPIGGYRFPSRRSVVYARRGVLATSRPLAASVGLQTLASGGNAFDAAVAAAATLAVIDPLSTGLGGDGFALCWSSADGRVRALNASGRAPRGADPEALRREFGGAVPRQGIHSVTVPGVVDGWAALLARYGTTTLAQALEPAIDYAAGGFPVPEILARQWDAAAGRLRVHPTTARTLLIDGRAPRVGEIFRQPGLARSLRLIAAGGRDAFYEGKVAERLVAFSRAEGGRFALDDFRRHRSEWTEPIRSDYRGCAVHECPPNSQGLIVLLALNLLAGYDLGRLAWGSAGHLHLLIEALKLAFADGRTYVADPAAADVPLDALLSEGYGAARRRLLDPGRAGAAGPGAPPTGDTVYVAAADDRGNVCSLINSISLGFGSGLVAGETGICLQNRGASFVLDPGHRNRLQGGKRPFHTIIPAMVLKDGRPWLCFGVVGGPMQPPGHIQVLSNIVDFGMGLQEALDAPRLRLEAGGRVAVEAGFDGGALAELRRRGHTVAEHPAMTITFGGGQLVQLDHASGVLSAASEPRFDGQAVGI
jgi:gamma-glutamyltranspeptidase / glutathione hydrolase